MIALLLDTVVTVRATAGRRGSSSSSASEGAPARGVRAERLGAGAETKVVQG
jgi:hypothetical protein